LRERIRDKIEAVIGNQGCPRIRDEGERGPTRKPREEMRPHDFGIVLVISDKRRRNAVMREQFLGDAHVLCNDRLGGGKRRQSPE